MLSKHWVLGNLHESHLSRGLSLGKTQKERGVRGRQCIPQPESPQSQVVSFLPIASITTSLSHGWVLLPQTSISLMAPVLGPRAAAHRMQETSCSSSITMYRLLVPTPCWLSVVTFTHGQREEGKRASDRRGDCF